MSTLDEIMERLYRLVDSFEFTRPGLEESLGRDCAHAAAEAIAEAAAEQRTTAGERFPTNEPKYAAWKDDKYGAGNPAYGIRTGQMLSLESLRGEITVSPSTVTMRYGTNRPPDRSSASGYFTTADAAITDRRKAEYNHDRMGKFYKLGVDGRKAVVGVVKEALGRAIRDEYGGS